MKLKIHTKVKYTYTFFLCEIIRNKHKLIVEGKFNVSTYKTLKDPKIYICEKIIFF